MRDDFRNWFVEAVRGLPRDERPWISCRLEHDWISRSDDIVHETPGSVHTLVLQEDSEIIFFVEGAIEYLDSEGHTLAHEDWRSVTDKHVAFCAERGLNVVDVARPRAIGHGRVAVA